MAQGSTTKSEGTQVNTIAVEGRNPNPELAIWGMADIAYGLLENKKLQGDK